jgi:hypothetical protein
MKEEAAFREGLTDQRHNIAYRNVCDFLLLFSYTVYIFHDPAPHRGRLRVGGGSTQ